MPKTPSVQKAWRDFKEKRDVALSILDGWKIVLNIQEILYWIVPYIIAGYWYSGFSRPRKYTVRKKNRNL